MNKLVKSLKKKYLFIIFIFALLLVFLIEFLFSNIPEKFNGGKELCKMISGLSSSYVSAYIFYLLVVYIKNQRDKKNLYGYISKKISTIIITGKKLINELVKMSPDIKRIEGSYPTKEELKQICENLRLNSDGDRCFPAPGNPGGIRNGIIIESMYIYKIETDEAIQKILSKIQFLDTILIKKLVNIEDCSYHKQVSIFAGIKASHVAGLADFETNLLKYFELIKNLEIYYNKELKKYEE